MSKRKQNVLQWAFHKCNMAGDQANLYDIIFKYETIWAASDEEQEAIMDYISSRMGLASYDLLTDEKWELLNNQGWVKPGNEYGQEVF